MLYDAHNHLQDDRLAPWREDIIAMLPQTGMAEMIVNGSGEDDWPAVAELARQHSWIRPAFGLHPWYVKERTPQWATTLRQFLVDHPRAVVGEIGLDRWIENPDIEAQLDCFRAQLALAVELDRPATIHCLLSCQLERAAAAPDSEEAAAAVVAVAQEMREGGYTADDKTAK